MTGFPTRRGFLALLGAAGAAALLPGGGCAHAATARTPSQACAPPPRVWDEAEILRTGPWAG